MKRFASGLALVALSYASVASAASVTVWVPAELKVDAAMTRIATVARTSSTSVKFSKACAKTPGKFDTYSATFLNTGLGTVQVAEIAVEKLPGKGLAVDLSSLRAEGECTDGGRKWHRFNAVVSEPPVSKVKPKPAPTSTPKSKTDPKKNK